MHRTATQRYGTLRREVQELLTEASAGAPITHEVIADLRKRWGDIDAESPIVPQKLHDAVALSLQRPAQSTAAGAWPAR